MQGEPVWKGRSSHLDWEVGWKQPGWEERLWRQELSCGDKLCREQSAGLLRGGTDD